MKNLRYVNLVDTHVTNAGLKHLPPASKVRWLNVSGTKVRLRALPHVRGVRLKVQGKKNWLVFVGSRRPDQLLAPGKACDGLSFPATSWSFRRDSRLVAIGTGSVRRNADSSDDEGGVGVWDTARGALLACYGAPELLGQALGAVREVAFLDDGQTVVFKTDRFSED
jgi:hypothetical protein